MNKYFKVSIRKNDVLILFPEYPKLFLISVVMASLPSLHSEQGRDQPPPTHRGVSGPFLWPLGRADGLVGRLVPGVWASTGPSCLPEPTPSGGCSSLHPAQVGGPDPRHPPRSLRVLVTPSLLLWQEKQGKPDPWPSGPCPGNIGRAMCPRVPPHPLGAPGKPPS